MAPNERLRYLFLRFYANEATATETDEFFRLIADTPDGSLEEIAKQCFDSYREENARFPTDGQELIYARIKDAAAIGATTHPTKRSWFSRRTVLQRAAAVFLATILVGGWFTLKKHESNPPISIAVAANLHVTDQIDTGTVRINGTEGTNLSWQEQSVINVDSLQKAVGSTAEFQTVTVPYGKRSEVLLPDGTNVWLNSGSRLTFPNTFSNATREVYLSGEGYFEVTASKETPFYVRTADMSIKVMGTSFNVRSYPEDAYASTVLLTGRIELEATERYPFEQIAIEPGTSAVLERSDRKLRISQVTAADEISWRDKQLILKSTPLSEILNRLSRIYNVKITDRYGKQSNETFSGRLDVSLPLEQVLPLIYDPKDGYTFRKGEGGYMIDK